MRSIFCSFALAIIAAGIMTQSSDGWAGPPKEKIDKAACVDAYGKAQKMRRDRQLRAAREQLLICAQQACPNALRSECVPWLTEVESLLPSIVVEARDPSGKDTSDVVVEMDGTVVAQRSDGSALEVDPGEHAFRFTHAGKTIEEKVVVREGERRRKIVVDYGKFAQASSSSATTTTAPPSPPATSAPVPTATWILGGVGVAALASFAVFALKGKSKENDLTTCSPNCARSDAESMRNSYLIADISLGVGLVSLGAATYLFITRDKNKTEADTSSAKRVDLVPTTGGAQLLFHGAF